jgi:hypothetical protein
LFYAYNLGYPDSYRNRQFKAPKLIFGRWADITESLKENNKNTIKIHKSRISDLNNEKKKKNSSGIQRLNQ